MADVEATPNERGLQMSTTTQEFEVGEAAIGTFAEILAAAPKEATGVSWEPDDVRECMTILRDSAAADIQLRHATGTESGSFEAVYIDDSTFTGQPETCGCEQHRLEAEKAHQDLLDSMWADDNGEQRYPAWLENEDPAERS